MQKYTAPMLIHFTQVMKWDFISKDTIIKTKTVRVKRIDFIFQLIWFNFLKSFFLIICILILVLFVGN